MSYGITLAARGGVPPYTWLAADLPPGLTLTLEGILNGTLEASCEFTPLITLKDSSRPPQPVAQRYTIWKSTPNALALVILQPVYCLKRTCADDTVITRTELVFTAS